MSFQTKQMFKRSIYILLLSLLIFIYFSWQFSPERRFTLFFLNKAVAETAVVLISLSYLIGPFCRVIPRLARYLAYRKYIGLSGFSFVVLHIVLSLLQWDQFGLSWYQDRIWGITAAYIATAIFLILAITSTNHAIKSLGSNQWKMVQRTGYVALVLAAFHIYAVSSIRWQQWFSGEVDMPSSFVVFAIAVFAIVVRFITLFTDRLYPRGGVSKK